MQPASQARRFFHLGLTGYPLSHSLSPVLHARALAAAGLDGEYCLYPVPPSPSASQGLYALLGRLRRGELDGLNVTIPHKQVVLPLVDRLAPAARRIGAANLLYWRGGQLVGDNTDAAGFSLDLHRFLEGLTLLHYHALVLGAGGAARAVAAALLDEGWQVIIAARRPDRARALAEILLPGKGKAIPLAVEALRWLKDIALVVNATPVGMAPDQNGCPWPEDLALPPGSAIYDLIYNPRETRLLQRAHAAGLTAASGLGMLVEQAALSFECWTGHPAPRPAMRQAVGLA